MTLLEAKSRADAYLSSLRGEPCAVFDWSARETRTHWRFFWNTVAAIEGRAQALKGVDPVAINKASGEVLLDPKRSPGDCLNRVFPSPARGPVEGVEEARRIAQAWLDATMESWSSILDHRELSYGWGFNWNVDEYLRTRDIRYALAGMGPLIVLKATGELFALGTATPFEQQCADFERTILSRR